MKIPSLFCCLLFCGVFKLPAQITTLHTQVLVIGGSTGGTAAGLQAAKSGAATIIIVEQTYHVRRHVNYCSRKLHGWQRWR